MRLKLASCSLALAALVLTTHQARADVVYSYVTDQHAYEVGPGSTAWVHVYLEERLTGGSSSELLAQHGLFSFDVAVDVASAPSDPAAIIASEANPDFNGVVNNVSSSMLIADRDVFESEGAQPAMVDDTTYRVRLATCTVQAGGLAGETTTFSVGDFENPQTPGAEENTFYWDDIAAADPLDAFIGAASFGVTVIPEPASVALIAAGGLTVFRRRKEQAGDRLDGT